MLYGVTLMVTLFVTVPICAFTPPDTVVAVGIVMIVKSTNVAPIGIVTVDPGKAALLLRLVSETTVSTPAFPSNDTLALNELPPTTVFGVSVKLTKAVRGWTVLEDAQ